MSYGGNTLKCIHAESHGGEISHGTYPQSRKECTFLAAKGASGAWSFLFPVKHI